ncbi:MAG TPA: PfkB family carbohydrate kinase [Syntrophales bacterium]|nr:PfkB family carbohydrate kinase [Syntrophales bacterium]
MPFSSTVQVFGLGQCSLDYIGEIPSYPRSDTKCEFTGLTVEGGGPVATALVALSRWGIRCAFSGVIGDDSFGTMIRRSLEGERIDTLGLLARADTLSQFAFIAVEPGSGRRTIFWQRPTGENPQPGEVQFDRIRRSSVLHTDGIFPEACLEACREARKAGVPVVVDAGSWREGLLEIARESDYFIAAEAFGTAIAGNEDPLDACRKIAGLGPRLAAVTLGRRGYAALADGKELTRPAHSAVVRDTTGCGDVFHAGFIYGLLQGWNEEKSLDLAAWSAARVSTRMGGRAGIPSLDDLRKRCRKTEQ